MDKRRSKEQKVKIKRTRILRYCTCPTCGKRQPFKKKYEYWKQVKDLNLNYPTTVRVRMISARCLNPTCRTESFMLPVPGIKKYARSTNRLTAESIAGIIQDNSDLAVLANGQKYGKASFSQAC